MIRSKTSTCALTFALALMAGQAGATLDIAQQPLFLGGFVEPNVLFILDDSGSMHWETMPDDLTGLFGSTTGTNSTVQLTFPMTPGVHGGNDYAARRVPRFHGDVAARFRSPHNNTVYYNPAITYQPWIQADGTLMENAPPDAAWHNPVNPGLGTRDLTSSQWGYADWVNNDGDHTERWLNFYPAVYYHYNAGPVGQESSYTRVEITSGNGPFAGHGRENRTDCDDGSCSYGQEIQNFANWYSYHRNRVFAARAGIGRAFSEQGERMRIGYGTINTTAHSVDGQSTQTVIHGVRRFTQETRANFFEELYERVLPPQGTPLREALQGAGEYYRRTDNQGPWSDTPGEAGGGDHLECRQSYTVLMTDGYWNQGDPVFTPVGNVDGGMGAPFADNWSDALADVAMEYWDNDLRPNLGDRVPTTELNPADWQHMVTFGVGLGVKGALGLEPEDIEDIFTAIENGEDITVNWPNPIPGGAGAAKIDDLLHAGVNSRGGFFSATNADEFSRELSAVLRRILALAGATTGVSVSSTRLDTGTLAFQAGFESDRWSGVIVAIDPLSGDQVAETTFPSSRTIFTSDGDDRVNFSTGMSADLKARIAPPGEDDSDLIDAIIQYIAGDDTHESPGTDYSFRQRNEDTVLGDIVNSEIIFSGKRNEGWARLGGDLGSQYAGFMEFKQDRDDMIYVGANDGMLHAFNAQINEDGSVPVSMLREQFAYIPNVLLDNLHELVSPDYVHRFFVDGQMSIGDAAVGGCSNGGNGPWCTVMVGSLGAGGQAIFALDVTNPGNPQVLWERSSDDVGFEDLGHTFGRPLITRLSDGTFVAIFGNGYRSGHNQPALYVVRLSDGTLLSKIDAPLNGDQPESNGLSSPSNMLDAGTGTYSIAAYAGDLNGNVWYFDLADESASLLFQDENNSPITAAPELSLHPSGGTMVFVGTGKMFEEGDSDIDPLDEPVRRFYSLRDRGNRPISGDNLAQLIVQPSASDPDQREIIANGDVSNGWYLDLHVGNDSDPGEGERVLSRARVIFGRVVFSSFQPGDDPCEGGGTGWLYVLNAITGEGLPGALPIETVSPASPPLVIRPPSSSDLETGYAPGGGHWEDPDEINPFDPDAAGTTGQRNEWCSDIGTMPDPTTFIPFGTLCEGRQVWREIR